MLDSAVRWVVRGVGFAHQFTSTYKTVYGTFALERSYWNWVIRYDAI